MYPWGTFAYLMVYIQSKQQNGKLCLYVVYFNIFIDISMNIIFKNHLTPIGIYILILRHKH